MFRRTAKPGIKAIVFIVISIVLMVLDQKVLLVQRLRADLAVAVLPIQYVVNTPIKFVHWLASNVSTQQSLLAENAKLRVRELLLQSKLQKLLALERENIHLRELFKSTAHIGHGHVLIAELLAVSLDPTLQQVIVNKGWLDHVYRGQPVLDAFGVMGQVVHVGPLTSKVLMITDTRSAVPVEDYRNGLRAIAVGLGSSGKLLLMNIPDTSDIRVGDLFVTSGLGLRYPVGYPVGVVFELKHTIGERFATILLRPSAHLDQTQQVLLAWPNNASLGKAVQKQLQASVSQ